ncbi:hypothetical protein [Pseudovibrio sp. Ad37]|uniref:hypothetical protein n=1 Tax=Pseudovibrio sp. Ad37 TaxID=989422 RepID=UPI0007AE7C06|nr:hypothetical protein [Pseudovibrio sp. Ad37]KZL25663.1 hypothetical protein PsAD37_02257 [Pseudovibrio sp. Ad37]
MSKKTKKNKASGKAESKLAQQAVPASVPAKGGQLIATAQNDITIANYSDILKLQDPTLEAKGVNERSKLIRHHHLKLTHLGWHKSSRRTALI